MIVVAGATGHLGGLIVEEILKRGGKVRALARRSVSAMQFPHLTGAEISVVNFEDENSMTRACEGASCVVSALAGLRETIVETQSRLAQAAARANVARFIPSDFSIDSRELPPGSNRNLNLREEFRQRLERIPIAATSIYNGAFADMLTGQAPFILPRIKRILCWGNRNQRMDFTTIGDTARFTAAAALDSETPRVLRIAGDQMSASDLADVMTAISGERYRALRVGGLKTLEQIIRVIKFVTPPTEELYPAWQGMQYMHNMYAGMGKLENLDNERYPMKWTRVADVLRDHFGQASYQRP